MQLRAPMKNWFYTLAGIVLLLGPTGVQQLTHAQQPYAAVMEVLSAGVEIQRVGTDQWLKLSAGAQAPLGTGDSLRTTSDGRALISFADAAQTLVLPSSEVVVTRFEEDTANSLIIDTHLTTGRSIQRQLASSLTTVLQLTTAQFTVTQPGALFAAQADATSSAVIVGEGSAVITGTDAEVTLQAGEGLTAAPALGEVIKLSAPYRFSFLTVTSEVCMGTALATLQDMESVFVRVGPAEDYRGLGQIPNGTKVAILGMTENGQRYRTPYLSGFGWVIANGIILNNCKDLPVLPNTAESVNSIRNAQPIELEFLQPFFGTPEEDTWYYIND